MTTAETTGPTFIEVLRLSARDLRSAAGEVPDVAADFRELVTGDVQLGAAEMRESATRAGGAAAIAGAAAVLVAVIGGAVILAPPFALSTAMAMWLASLITMFIVFGAAYVAYRIAMSRFKGVSAMPKRAIESLGKDISWLKAQLNLSAN